MINYDSLTQFDGDSGSFVCQFDHHFMSFEQGIFAVPDHYEANFAPVIRCPYCGHSMDVTTPAYILNSTPGDDPLYAIRSAAVMTVIDITCQMMGYWDVVAAWEVQQVKIARRENSAARRADRIAALELVETVQPVVTRSWWQRLLGK